MYQRHSLGDCQNTLKGTYTSEDGDESFKRGRN